MPTPKTVSRRWQLEWAVLCVLPVADAGFSGTVFVYGELEVPPMNSIFFLILIILNSSILCVNATENETCKVVSDGDEFAAFVEARDTPDGLRKAARMEAFVRDYPESVLAVNAMEHALVAYQHAGLYDKAEQTAEEILQMERGNVIVLSTLTYIQRVKSSKGDPDAAEDAKANGKRGLGILSHWKKPPAISEAEYEKLRRQMTAIFAGAAAYGAQQEKDYFSAREYYLVAVQAAPDSLADYYQLAVTCLDMPVPDVNGFWYLARAYHLAGEQKNRAIQEKIAKSGRARYRAYHGSADGWDQLLASATQQDKPPADFVVKPSPSPCERAVALATGTNAALLTFSDWKLILSKRNCSPAAGQAAQKVWQYIQDKQNHETTRLVIPAKILSTTGTTVVAAVTQEGRRTNTGELLAQFDVPPENMPAVYADVNIVGILSEYTSEPFLLKMKASEVR